MILTSPHTPLLQERGILLGANGAPSLSGEGVGNEVLP